MAWQRREERRATPPILEYFSRLITGAEGGAFHPRDGPDQELSNDHFHSFPPQATPLHPGFTPFSMKNSQARASETPPSPFSIPIFSRFYDFQRERASLILSSSPFYARPRLLPLRGKYPSSLLLLPVHRRRKLLLLLLSPLPLIGRSNNYFEQSVRFSFVSFPPWMQRRPFFYALNNPATIRRINLACPKAYYLTYIHQTYTSRGSFNPLETIKGDSFSRLDEIIIIRETRLFDYSRNGAEVREALG